MPTEIFICALSSQGSTIRTERGVFGKRRYRTWRSGCAEVLFYLFSRRKEDERAKLMRNLRKSVFRCVDFVVPVKADMDFLKRILQWFSCFSLLFLRLNYLSVQKMDGRCPQVAFCLTFKYK